MTISLRFAAGLARHLFRRGRQTNVIGNPFLRSYCAAAVMLLTVAAPARAGVLYFNNNPNAAAGGYTSTATFDYVNIYRVGTGIGVAFMLPAVNIGPGVAGLSLPGTNGQPQPVLTTLNAAAGAYKGAAGGWSYAAGATLPNNSLQVTAYDVCCSGANPTDVGIQFSRANKTAGFGVIDKNPPAGNDHWVQVLATNHKANNPFGTPDNKIDVGAADTTPYYDVGGTANGANLLDAPHRHDPTDNNWWAADLFVATGPAGNAPGAVTLYNGIFYGWADLFFNNVFTVAALGKDFGADMLSVANFDTALGGVNFGGDVTQASLNTIESEFLATAVPEPATWALMLLGFVGLGFAGYRRARSSGITFSATA